MSTSSQAVLPTLDRKLSLATRAASPPARVHSARTPHRERGRASAPPPHPRVAPSPHHALFGARAALVRMNPSTRACASAPRCGRPRPHTGATPSRARPASARPPPRHPAHAPHPVRCRARRLRRRRHRAAAGCGGRGHGHATCAPSCWPRRTPPTPSRCSASEPPLAASPPPMALRSVSWLVATPPPEWINDQARTTLAQTRRYLPVAVGTSALL